MSAVPPAGDNRPARLAREAFYLLQEYRHAGLGIKAFSKELGCSQVELKQCLQTTLKYRVWQDASKRWHLKDKEHGRPFSREDKFDTPLTSLSLYYRDCINQGTYVEVSVPAAGGLSNSSYCELDHVPQHGSSELSCREPEIQSLMQGSAEDHNRRVMWMGYPVLLTRDPNSEDAALCAMPVLLWAINTGDAPGKPWHLQAYPPMFNGAFLVQIADDDGPELAREALRLSGELGLDRPLAKRPSLQTLALELQSRNSHWSWRERLDPRACTGPALCRLQEEGIYNRCMVVSGERSGFIRGLQQELVKLTGMHQSYWESTALGSLVLDQEAAQFEPVGPLAELVAMNTEQRQAVQLAIGGQACAITGPPGTGKSQTEVNLIGNALLRGGSVLFASKNHKAVSIVEKRFNDLAERPVLYRHGSHGDKLRSLADFLEPMLEQALAPIDEQAWSQAIDELHRANRGMAHLDTLLADLLGAHARLARSDEQADVARQVFGALAASLEGELAGEPGKRLVEQVQAARWRVGAAIDMARFERQSLLRKLLWRWIRPARLQEVERVAAGVRAAARVFGVELPRVCDEASLGALAAAVDELSARIPLAQKIVAFRADLAEVKALSPMEEISSFRALAEQEVVACSRRVWKLHVQDEPRRLGEDWLQCAWEFVSLVKQRDALDDAGLTAGEGAADPKRVWALYHKLLEKLPCQAVTSLSARSTLPLKEGRFDFLVIDEASQCDIASALPMLFRAKHLAVFGDPKQLRHVTPMSEALDEEFMAQRGLHHEYDDWQYSRNSLFHLVAARIGAEKVHLLRDHHRCHVDIARFVSREFYGDELRVATRHSDLRRPDTARAGIVWQGVQGSVMLEPGRSGAYNEVEAWAVIDYLEDLLLVQKFAGTVGVVTPFRLQADLLNELIQQHPGLQAVKARANLQAHTAHRFQGDERDVIVLSPVISQGAGRRQMTFLRGTGELFNVAITRARALLHVVGDREAAARSEIGYLCRFVEHVSEIERRVANRVVLDPATLGPTYPQLSGHEQVSQWEKLLYEALYAQGLRPVPRHCVDQYELQFAVFVGRALINIEVDVKHDRSPWTLEECRQAQVRDQRLQEMDWNIKRVLVCELRDDPQACIRDLMKWIEELQIVAG